MQQNLRGQRKQWHDAAVISSHQEAAQVATSAAPTAVQEFMWQEDLVSVANQTRSSAPAAGPSHDGQASDQPNVAGRDVMIMMVIHPIAISSLEGIIAHKIAVSLQLQ